MDITVGRLSERLAADQLDAILGMVNDALRARLEKRLMREHVYRSPLFRGIYRKAKAEGKAQGMAEGIAEGQARGILVVLEARGIPVSALIRDRILGCTDVATLDVWIRRAAAASTAASVVRAKAPAVPAPRAPARRARTA